MHTRCGNEEKKKQNANVMQETDQNSALASHEYNLYFLLFCITLYHVHVAFQSLVSTKDVKAVFSQVLLT
jgi:hypothetical protein